MVVPAVILLLLSSWEAHSDKVNADFILQRMINESYDVRVRPPAHHANGSNAPVLVDVNLYIRSISNIDFVSMHYDLQITFREMWKDPRLAYDHLQGDVPKFIILTDRDIIWRPDTFFPNEKRAHRHEIDKPNILIRVQKDGTVLFSERITLTASCPMYLQRYPMDVQQCTLDLASYAFTTKDLKYTWKEGDAFQLHNSLHESLPSFTLSNVETSLCTSKTNTGEYSCLRTTFRLSRQFSYYVVQVYIPSTLLVIVSWVSFWLERTAVPARVTLGVTTLLTMTTQAASISNKLPPVSYIKAIDIWIGVCLLFIFGAVLEFAWVSYVATRLAAKCQQNGHDSTASPRENELRKEEDTLLDNASESRGSRCNFFVCKMFEHADEAKLIDVKSRIAFPAVFLLFNVLYWIVYYNNS